MSTSVRLAVAVITALVIVGLLAWARGPEHHRGDEVGASMPLPVRITGR